MEEVGLSFFKANDISSLQESQDMIRMRTIERLFGQKDTKNKPKARLHSRSLTNTWKYSGFKNAKKGRNNVDIFDLIEIRRKRRNKTYSLKEENETGPGNYVTCSRLSEEENKDLEIKTSSDFTELEQKEANYFPSTRSSDSVLFRFRLQQTKIYSEYENNFNLFSSPEEDNLDNESPFSPIISSHSDNYKESFFN